VRGMEVVTARLQRIWEEHRIKANQIQEGLAPRRHVMCGGYLDMLRYNKTGPCQEDCSGVLMTEHN
jgi:hypothetical protein